MFEEEMEEYKEFFGKYGDEIKDKIQNVVRKDKIQLDEIKKIVLKYDKNVTKQEINGEEILDNKVFSFIEEYLAENNIIIVGNDLNLCNEVEKAIYDRARTEGVSYTEVMKQVCDSQKNIDLAKRIQNGDPFARDEMIVGNLRLVFAYMAPRIKYLSARVGSDEIEDLIQEGIMGLMSAIDRYDYTRGNFSTYAYYWIRQKITRAIDENSRGFRVPVHASEQINKINRIVFKFQETLGRDPTESELAESLGVSQEMVSELMDVRTRKKVESLEEIRGEKQELKDYDYAMSHIDEVSNYENASKRHKRNLHKQRISKEKEEEYAGLLDTDRTQNIKYDTIVDGVYLDQEELPMQGFSTIDERQGKDPADKLEGQLLNEDLNAMFDDLRPREKNVIEKRYFDEQTLEEVGKEMKGIANPNKTIDKERVRQIEAKGLMKLRNPVRSKYIKDYYDETEDLEQYIEPEKLEKLKKERIERFLKIEENIASLNMDEIKLFLEYCKEDIKSPKGKRFDLFIGRKQYHDKDAINDKYKKYFSELYSSYVLLKLEEEIKRREETKNKNNDVQELKDVEVKQEQEDEISYDELESEFDEYFEEEIEELAEEEPNEEYEVGEEIDEIDNDEYANLSAEDLEQMIQEQSDEYLELRQENEELEDKVNESKRKSALIQKFKEIKAKTEQEETKNSQLKMELAALNKKKKEGKGDE